jgi:hypothetical protein
MVNTPAGFATPEDICNRALQHIGGRRITSLTDGSVNANECQFVYDKLRRAELRRNTWVFSTRRAALRPMAANTTLAFGSGIYTPKSGPNTGTLLLVPDVWNASTTYTPGAIVQDPSVPTLFWTSLEHENIGNAPGDSTVWDVYFGPMVVSPYDPTETYWAGELVYIRDPNTQAVNVYRSLVNGNGNSNIQTVISTAPSAGTSQTTTSISISADGIGNPWVLTEWNPLVTYNRDQVVSYQFTLYRSATEQNIGNIPGAGPQWITCGPVDAPTIALASNINWLPIPATVKSTVAAYPIGAGPVQEASTRNAFKLPNGYLREAPQDPTQGAVSYLGAPGGLTYSDWVFEGGYLTSRMSQVILLRFIADITDVRCMDDMFCEGLAARIALEICEPITQDLGKAQKCAAEYNRIMGEARIVNAIESGSDQPPEDDYISCRA